MKTVKRMSKPHVHVYPEWAKEISNRSLDSCPNCGRKKQKRNKECAECKQKRTWSFNRKPKEDIYSYCQYTDCPSRLIEHLKETMIKYTRVRTEFLFCTEECKEGFIKDSKNE